MNKITLKQLKQAKACTSQIELFEKKFGEEVVLTTSLALQVYKEFDVGWCVSHLLSGLAWAEYEKINGPAWAEYDKICAVAFVDCYNNMPIKEVTQ